MQLNFSQKWFDKMVVQEKGHDIGAGPLSLKPYQDDPRSEQEQIAFSTLIQLLRRRRRLSIESLAAAARIDISEVCGIELDPHFQPKPRSVHQLAAFFKLPVQPLTALAGLADGNRAKYFDAAVVFAAKSKGTHGLNREEKALLNEFVKILSTLAKD